LCALREIVSGDDAGPSGPASARPGVRTSGVGQPGVGQPGVHLYIVEVRAATYRLRRVSAFVGLLLVALFGAAACGQTSPKGSAATTRPAPQPTTRPAPKPSGSTPSTALSPPKTSFAQDTKYFTYVTEADPELVTYEKQQGNVALRALLTDGSAFCALLRRGGGIDAALVAEADGARSTESVTKLPLSVTTFNTIESVALLTLCPSEQALVPASDRARIRNLGDALAQRSG
jgi:hypothetical protein